MADLLIVEDDPDAAESLALVLELEGHTVRVAFDGDQGLRRVHERAPDLVLTDIEMPLLDGPGLAYRMFVHDVGLEKVPIVLVSGFPDIRRIAAQVGTPYYLSKPYALERLLRVVERALVERVPPRPESLQP